MVYFTKIIKVGSSHGVVIPVNILNAYNWQRGDFLICGFAGGDQLYLKRPSDAEINLLKPHEDIPLV